MKAKADKQALKSVESIDVTKKSSLTDWAKMLDVSEEQIHEAVQAVGNKAGDVEMHLKGSRASTNAAKEQVGERISEKR